MKLVTWMVRGTCQFGALSLIIPLLLVITVMGQLDAVLADMHLAGARAGSITSIANPLTSANTAEQIRSAWVDWDLERLAQEKQQTRGDEEASGGPAAQGGRAARVAGAAQPVPPGTVAAWWLLLDTLLLAPLLALVLVLLNRSRFAALDDGEGGGIVADGGEVRRAVRAMLGPALVMVGLYLVADILENGLTFASVTGDLDGGVDLIALIRWMSLGKVLAFALALLPILVSFAWASAVAARRLGQSLIVLRAQAVGAGLVFVILVLAPGDVGNQLADVARSLGEHPAEIVAALVLMTCLGSFIWVSGARLLIAHASSRAVLPGRLAMQVETRGLAPDPTAETWWSRAKAVACHYRRLLALTAVPLLLLPAVSDVPWQVAVLPLSFVVVHALLSGVVAEVWALPGHRPQLANPSWALLGLLTFLPIFSLVLLWFRAETGLANWRGATGAIAVILVVALVVLWGAIGHGVERRATSATYDEPRIRSIRTATVGMILLVLGVVIAWAGGDAVAAGRALGALAFVAVLAQLVTVLLTAGVVALDRRPPRGAFAVLRLKHFPVITLTILLLVLAAQVHSDPGFHRARVLDNDPGARSGVPQTAESLAEAFNNWLEETDDEGGAYEPLFIVAASGGASRSAYWTMLALECLFGERVQQGTDAADNVLLPACSGRAPGGLDQVLLSSGISGGSVGLTMYAADAWDRNGTGDFDEEAPFRGPSLGPVAAGLSTVDLLNSFTQATEIDLPLFDALHLDDRASVLEQEWQQHLPELEAGFFVTQMADGGGNFPRLMLNSASVEDGCIFNTSVLDLAAGDVVEPDEASGFLAQCRSLGRFDQSVRDLEIENPRLAPLPGARDLADYICDDEDLRLSTAALLSARFPYVSPTGALQRCGPDDNLPFTYLVDGGYVDSSAASQTTAVLDELVELVRDENNQRLTDGAPCVQPLVLQLDNGYEDEAGAANPGRPLEAVAPPSGNDAVNSGRAQAGRQLLAEHATALLRADAIGCPAAPDLPRYLRIYPRSHPGLQAPMGWQLSDRARHDLRDQLGGSANQCALLTARAWLNGASGEPSPAPALSCVQGLVQQDDKGLAAAELRLCADDTTTADDCTRTITDRYGAFSALVETEQHLVRIDADANGTVDNTQNLACPDGPVCSRRLRIPEAPSP